MKPSVIWVNIPATDLNRATAFYSAIFEQPLKIVEQGPQRMANLANVEDGKPGCSILHIDGYAPTNTGPLTYFSVESLEPVLERVNMAGGIVQIERAPMGEAGHFATFNDSEGNTIGLFTGLV